MLVPIGLSPMYELPTRLGLLEPRVVTASLDVLAPPPIVGRPWDSPAPVSGFAHAGFQLTADRYSYLPGMAAAPLVGAAVGGPPRRSPGQARGGGRRARGDGLVGGLAILTSRQVGLAKTPRACGVRRSG